MKILIVHNRYQQAGGEDNVVSMETKLLQENGQDVECWIVDNKDLTPGLAGKIKIALTTNYSTASRKTFERKLHQFQPDVVHVHNFFPQISPSIYDACQELNIPVVQTLHNYRLICPGAMLMRDGKICEKCITGSPYQAVVHNCYRDSRLGSLVLAHMVNSHRHQRTWQHKVNQFIALTDFAKSKFVQAGFPAEKISVKANFLPDPFLNHSPQKRVQNEFALFVGRISAEKGIKTLLVAWEKLNTGILLKVAGSGPLANLVPNNKNIESLGRQTPEQISQLMSQASFLVLPSEWYEGFPLVLVEAFAHGLPVLASNLGSMADIIEDGKTGLLFKPADSVDLAKKVRWLIENPNDCKQLGKNCRASYIEKYTPSINYQELMAIYTKAKIV